MRFAAVALVSVLGLAQFAAAQAVVPVANAGPDVTVACSGTEGTPQTLDGLGSSIGPGFSYLWTAPGVEFNDETILAPIGVFPVGTTEVTLTVTFTDSTGETSASDTVLVTVTDESRPLLLVSPDPAVLWPPNHKLHDVHVDVLVFDACDPAPTVELLDVFSDEPDDGIGDGNTDGDIQGAEVGTDDRDFALRAERAGPGDGRTYTAVYGASDLAGNAALEEEAVVAVPHDMGRGAANGHDDGWKQAKKEIAKAKKAAKKAAKQQMKAAKKAAKLAKKAYKVAYKAAKKAQSN